MSSLDPARRSTSESAVDLKDAISLRNNRGIRNRHGLFFVEGVRNSVRAVDNGFVIERILFSEKLLINPLARMLVRRCRRAGVHTVNLPPQGFRRLSTTKRASGVAAVVRQKWARIQDVSATQNMCCVMLETVQSAGNFGTLIRSSNAAGGAGFIIIGRDVDPFAPSVIRSAMGAILQQTFVRTDCSSLYRWVDENNCAVIGATPTASEGLHEFDYPASSPLHVLGEERKGLSERQKTCAVIL